MSECQGCRREAHTQPTCPRCSGTGNEPRHVPVELWVCPQCESYFGASTAGDLQGEPHRTLNGGPKPGNRANCPYCYDHPERERCKAVVMVPVR